MTLSDEANRAAEKIAYEVIESICHIVDRNIYNEDILKEITPSIAAEIERLLKSQEWQLKTECESFHANNEDVALEAKFQGRKEGLLEAAEIAENYWAHIPQEVFDDGFEIPKKDMPDFVHEDIAKQIRAKAKGLD